MGAVLRLQECLSLRIKDVDIEQGTLIVRAGKGDKDRRTVLPESLKDSLIRHIAETRSLYDSDRKSDMKGVYLPNALEKKYPNAGKEWGWFWLFPSKSISVILAPILSAVIICTQLRFKRHLKQLQQEPESQNKHQFTHLDPVLQRNF